MYIYTCACVYIYIYIQYYWERIARHRRTSRVFWAWDAQLLFIVFKDFTVFCNVLWWSLLNSWLCGRLHLWGNLKLFFASYFLDLGRFGCHVGTLLGLSASSSRGGLGWCLWWVEHVSVVHAPGGSRGVNSPKRSITDWKKFNALCVMSCVCQEYEE